MSTTGKRPAGCLKKPRLEFFKAGLAFQELPEQYLNGMALPGGVSREEWDTFHILIKTYEVNRICSICSGEGQQKRWLAGITSGETTFCLGVTEPTGGSDVANLRTMATRTDDGKAYIVNGNKKWITGGMSATHMTTAVRTGGPGAGGVSILFIELDSPGVTRRKIMNSGWHAAESTGLTLDDVVVPAENLAGEENKGFLTIMKNFNRERLVLAVGMNTMTRACLEDAWAYCLDHETFGKPLFSHQIIRHKLAILARYTESHWAWIEPIGYHAKVTGDVGDDFAARIALAKVHGGRLLELANREAQQIVGGAGY